MKKILVITILSLSLSSCIDVDDNYTELYPSYGNSSEQAEMLRLSNYIQSIGLTTSPTSSGLYYVEKKAGNGNLAKENDTVLVSFKASFINNGPVWNSTYEKFTNLDTLDIPVAMIVNAYQMTDGLREGVKMMKTGTSSRLIVPSKLAFGNYRNYYGISPYSTLLYDVKLDGIGTAQFKEYEKTRSIEYLKKDTALYNHYKQSSSGLIYVIHNAGTEIPSLSSKNLTIQYESYYFNKYKVYFSGDYDKDGNCSIYYNSIDSEGLREALSLIGKNGSLTAIIPSYLLRGSTFKYCPIVFKIRIVDFQ